MIEELKNRLREIDWEYPEKNVTELMKKIEWQTIVFKQYEIQPPLDWKDYIYYWLTQFDGDGRILIAMKLINNIIFIDVDLYRELQKYTYQELKDYVHYAMGMEIEDFLRQTLFFPVDGSGEVHLIDFMRINRIKGRKDRVGGRLYLDEPDILLEPIKSIEKLQNLRERILEMNMREDEKEFIDTILYSYELDMRKRIEELKKRYKTRKYLCIVTDFVGTGTTIIKDIRRIIKYYENFEKIFVVDYVGTECGLEKIQEESQDKIETIICGLELPDYLRVFSEENTYFTDEEKNEIKCICDAYFSRFFHPDIEKFGDKIKYGYIGNEHSCGNSLLLTLYTNCPNNSLPILWAGSYKYYNYPNKWIPLFERVPSYVYHIVGGGKYDRQR